MARICLQATFSTTVDVTGQQQASSFFLFAMWEGGKRNQWKKWIKSSNLGKFLLVWPKKWPYIRLLWLYSQFIFTIKSPKWFGSSGKWSYNQIVLISGVFISGFYCTVALWHKKTWNTYWVRFRGLIIFEGGRHSCWSRWQKRTFFYIFTAW